jgi:hypothetical protein
MDGISKKEEMEEDLITDDSYDECNSLSQCIIEECFDLKI